MIFVTKKTKSNYSLKKKIARLFENKGQRDSLFRDFNLKYADNERFFEYF